MHLLHNPIFPLPACEFKMTLSIFFLASWISNKIPILSLLIFSSTFLFYPFSFIFLVITITLL